MHSTKAAKTRGLVVAITIVVIATFAPAVVVSAVGWTSVLSVAMLAGLAASMATAMGQGWRTGLVLAAPLAALTGLVVWASPFPLLAAMVMAGAAFLRGYAATIGLHNALTCSVIALGFFVTQPPRPQVDLAVPVFAGLVVLATVLWVTLIAFAARKWVHPRQLARVPRTRALAFSSVLALMVGVATWFAIDLKLGHAGGWIILTILVVLQPYLQDGMRKAFERAGGTFLGFLIAILIGLVITDAAALYVIGTGFLIVASVLTVLKRPYWLFATFLTPAIVLFDGAGSSVLHVAEVRLGATMIAVIGTMAVILALTPVVKRLSLSAGADHY